MFYSLFALKFRARSGRLKDLSLLIWSKDKKNTILSRRLEKVAALESLPPFWADRGTASMGQYMEEVGGPAGGVEPGETGDVHADGSWGVVGKEDGVWGVGESQQGGKEVSRPC